MSTTLKLKKPAAPSISQGTDVAQSVPPLKPAKQPSPKEIKDAQKEANRLLNEEMRERRIAQMPMVKALLNSYLSDKAALHEVVVVDGVECLKPLTIGVHKTVFAWLRAQPETQGCSNAILWDSIKGYFKHHVSRRRYASGLVKFEERFNLDGSVEGRITEKHKDHAQKRFQRISKSGSKKSQDAVSPASA